jgi:hypothetical protein
MATDHTLIAEAIEAAKDGKSPDELLGECPYNARRLHDELSERGIEAHIICGGLDRPEEDGRPTSMEEAEEMGAVHWWDEAFVEESWYTLDIAAEIPGRRGDYINTRDRPAAYIPFEIDPPDTEVFASR